MKKKGSTTVLMPSLRKQVVADVLWRFAEQFETQIITFVVSTVLAHLLPDVSQEVVTRQEFESIIFA